MNEPHRFATSAWELKVPFGVTSRTMVDPPSDSDISTMAVCWGYLGSGAWVRIVIGTRPRKGRTLRSWVRRLSGVDGRAVYVVGAYGARRAEFTVERDEPVDGQTFERVTLVVAAGRREYVSIAIGTIGQPASAEIDAIVDSLKLLDA